MPTDEHTISLSPTKTFFVNMLTRDIALEDAILDLLDNCVDGAMRSTSKPDSPRPYEGFFADLEFKADHFKISDNCGGIADDVRDSAFRLGRPPQIAASEEGLATVGVYGIGMKRAIFRLGRAGRIETHTQTSGFFVEIPREWMADESTWDLPVVELAGTPAPGTVITVTDLHEEIADLFRDESNFMTSFRSRVAQYYSVLIDKGFEVRILGKPIPPISLVLRISNTGIGEGISPYIYESTENGVKVEVIVGFFAPFESDPDEDALQGRAEEAGWTIVCNDRVVVYKDKTNLTGWGDGAPSYHPQFRQIAGLVTFSSSHPERLPITTTKRGVNLQNPIYLDVRKRMREGLVIFTSFTNQLKKLENADREILFRSTKPVELKEVRESMAGLNWSNERGKAGRYHKPQLPKVKDSGLKRMSFSRPIAEVRKVAAFLCDDMDTSPSEVAQAAFDYSLESAKELA